MRLTTSQTQKFHDQILIVLADYQNTMPANCPQCFAPFRSSDDSAVIVRARLEHVELTPNNRYCAACGVDAYGFARGEKQRTEVARRIMENLKLCAKIK
jgi:hypothetical protein